MNDVGGCAHPDKVTVRLLVLKKLQKSQETHRASVRLLLFRLLNVKYEKCFVNAVQNIVTFKL